MGKEITTKENTVEVVKATPEEKTVDTQSDDALKTENANLKAENDALKSENKDLKAELEELNNTIVDLNDALTKAEKPSFETVQANLKKEGLNAVTHRGEVKSSTIGSVNGTPIHELSDEELDELEEIGVIQTIED